MRISAILSAIAGGRAALTASFEVKIVLLSVAATVVALAMSFSIFQWRDWSADQADLADDQMTYATKIAAGFSSSAPDGVARAQATFAADEHAIQATYFFANGRESVLHHGSASVNMAPSHGRVPSTALHLRGVETYVPTLVNGRWAGELVLASHNAEGRASLKRNVLLAGALSVLATLLAAFVARTLARRALRPLYALNRAIEQVRSSKDFSQQVITTSRDEFGRLAENFNALLSELESYSSNLHKAFQEVTSARDVAEQANLLKSQFLANMSHEIRTPLNGVLGMAQVMAGADLSAPQRERLDVIQTSGVALLRVLNDILDLSKIEAGFLELEDMPFDIEEVTDGACAAFAATARAQGLTFTLQVADEAKGSWQGDPTRIRQILSNLVSNAIKFTEQGEVTVRIERGPSDRLAISVSDTGIGVSEENLPKLFERFSQADNTTTRRFGGTGLGLTICRHVVELMGGRIEVQSQVGVGTVFRAEFPLSWLGPRGAVHAPPMDAGNLHADLSRLRVLAAEDNLANQLVLTALLQSLGVASVTVANGREAVDAWRAGGFDLILMDIQMPVLDGVAATQEIRAIEREAMLPQTRIVALSANAMRHQVVEYLGAGMDGHIAKPIALDQLSHALAEAVQQPASAPVARTA